jgi:hypothetical protein
MGINLGGAFTIEGVSGAQALKIAGASNAFNIDTSGRTTYPNQIGFIAGVNTDSGWTAQAGAAWTIQNFQNVTSYNKGGGFLNGRFTAPVAGCYLLHWTAYQYKASAVQGHYIHPQFWVNGAGTPTTYRLLAYFSPAGYSFDSEIADIIYLNAGDYVELQIYHAAAGLSVYRAYSQFSGFLVG